MTKRLEEELGLPPLDNVMPETESESDSELTKEEIETQIAETSGDLEITERVDSALPMVQGFEHLEREMDEYADKAMSTFDTLVDLGMNVEDRHAAPIFDSASKMLTAALTAKQAKLDKKMRMIDLQMRKAKLDLEERKVNANLKDKEDNTEEIEGKVIGDRSTMLQEILSKIKDNDK